MVYSAPKFDKRVFLIDSAIETFMAKFNYGKDSIMKSKKVKHLKRLCWNRPCGECECCLLRSACYSDFVFAFGYCEDRWARYALTKIKKELKIFREQRAGELALTQTTKTGTLSVAEETKGGLCINENV